MALPTAIGVAERVGAVVAATLGGAYVAVVVTFGLLWLLLNLYQYVPLVLALARTPLRRLRTSPLEADRAATADGGPLPTIDVLLAAYDEASVIEQAVRSVYEADYPNDRLQLHVLIEPDDDETRGALRSLVDRYGFNLYTVPADYPGEPSKPRALNYGFSVTLNDVVGVIDAEDVVDPRLFREAAAAIRDRGRDYALARLDMANEVDGWLNLLFRAEYGFWYRFLVPAFAQARYPVPLGGTSCFFRRSVLEAVADDRAERSGPLWGVADRLWLAERGLPERVPWDPGTVTEDFELGLRLWTGGYAFAYLDAVTREESPVSLAGWLDQRVRWQKGKLQTFAAFRREPPPGLRRRLHVWWQSALPHLGPVNVVGVAVVFWLATVVGVVPGSAIGRLLEVALGFLVASSALFVAGYWSATDEPRSVRARRGTIVGLTVGFYWALQWLADVRALLDYHRGRFQWTPSTHLGRHVGSAAVSAAAYVDRPARDEPLTAAQVGAGLAGVLAVALAARGYALDRWSLWHDELYTIVTRGAAPVGELVTITADPHPPLYYLVVHGWMAAFGSTPTPMRALSILFSLGTVAAVFLLGRRVYDDRTGLVAALLVAVSTVHIHFGRTVRMYSLFTLLAALSWYAYVGLRTDGRCFDWLARERPGRSLAYLLVTAAMLYTHVYGLFVVASQHAVELLSEDGRVERRRWWALQAGLALLYLPWAVVLGRQVWQVIAGADGASPIAWIPEPSVGLFRETVLLFGGFPSIYPIDAGSPLALAAVVVALFVVSVGVLLSVLTWDDGPERTYYLVDGRRAAILGLFAVGLFVPFGLSYVLVPVFVPRYAIGASLPLFVLVARGLRNVPERRWRAGLLATLLLASAATTGLYYTGDTRADWRAVGTHLGEEASPDDLVVIQPTWIEADVDYYAAGLAADRLRLRDDGHVTPADRARLRELAASHGTVWLVRHAGTEADAALAVLREHRRQAAVIDGGIVELYRFE